VQSVRSVSLKFSSGTIYEIDAETKFAELTYDVVIAAELAFTEQQIFPSAFGGLGVSFGGIGAPFGMGVPRSLVQQERDFFSAVRTFRSQQEQQRFSRVVKSYAVFAKAQISIRLVKDTLTENELDRVEINKVEEMAEAKEVPPPAESPRI
jgi:hypothetical protein